MLKRIGAVCLILTMSLSFAACDQKQEEQTTALAQPTAPITDSGLDEPSPEQEEESKLPDKDTQKTTGKTADGQGGSGERETKRITFSEGRTIAWMAINLEKLGICDRKSLLKAAESMDLSGYSVATGAGKKSNCAFRLEGYAYPSTYDFYTNMKAEDVWKVFLQNTQQMITQADKARANELGYSLNDILTIASILQKECKEKDMKVAASVIYNRLRKGQKLQMDSTINYVENALVGFTTVTSGTRSSYNTYKCSALPAGPICNPGRAAINAALYPAQTEYYYFCTSADESQFLAAKTLQEHYKNCDTLGIGHKEGT